MAQIVRNSWNQTSEDREDLVNDANEESINGRDEQVEEQSIGGQPIVYTSQWATLVIIVNVTVGIGLLALPFSIQISGIFTSLIVQAIFVTIIIITCIICTELTVKTNVNSYHQIIQKHCHRYVYNFTQVSILLLVFGTTVAYIVTIGDQSDRLFATLYGRHFCHSWYLNRRFIMVMATLIFLKPLCSARTVDFLKHASSLGLVSIGFIFYVVLNSFIHSNKIAGDVNYLPKSIFDLSAILPVFCIGYQCHLSLVPTVATIHRREKPKAFITTTIAMIVATLIYASISVLAILRFGSSIDKDLTENFKGNDWVTITTIAIVAIKSILTLPAAYLPARLSIVDILHDCWPRFSQFSEPVQRIGVTILFLNLSLILALLVPDIVVAVGILGFLAVFFVFQLPGLAYLSLIKQNRLEKQEASEQDTNVPHYTARDKMKIVTSYFLIIFGSIMTAIVLYKSVDQVLSNTSSPPLCEP